METSELPSPYPAFLRFNGYQLHFADAEAYAFLLDLYESGAFRFHELEKWLRQHAIATDAA
jgi:prophage maintenance system killer protein